MSEGLPHKDEMNLQEARRIAGLIAGFIQESLSEKEMDELDEWVGASDENMLLFEQLTDEKNLSRSIEWLDNIDTEAALQKIKGNAAERPEKKGMVRKIWTYAAAVVVLVIIGVSYYKSADENAFVNNPVVSAVTNDEVKPGGKKAILLIGSGSQVNLSASSDSSFLVSANIRASSNENILSYQRNADENQPVSLNTLKTPAGGEYQVSLPDGTKVWLNAASSLTYPVVFQGAERLVELSGEAYFEVEKDKTKPFLVKCGNTTVRVTGTHFNVYAYEEENSQRITLLEGGIELQRGDQRVKLTPDQQAIISKEKKIVVRRDTKAEENISWTKGLFAFRKAPIEQVMQQVARWYNITIQYEGKTDQEFSGNILRSSTLEEVLHMLELSGGIHFVINGRQVIIRS